MSFNLPRFVRDLAAEHGIPKEHHSAVVHRAEMARVARNKIGFRPLAGSGPAIVLASSLDGVDVEIDKADMGMCRRIVSRAADDHARGLLERYFELG